MVGKRPKTLLASGLGLLLLCLDATPVSLSTERIGLATEGFTDLVSVGPNHSLLKRAEESNLGNVLSVLILLLSKDSMVSV